MSTIPCDNCENRGWLRVPMDFRGPDGPAQTWCPECNEDKLDYDIRMMRENSKLRRLESALRAVVECKDYESGYVAHHGDCNLYHAWGKGPHPCDCDTRHITEALAALDGNVLDDIVVALNENDEES